MQQLATQRLIIIFTTMQSILLFCFVVFVAAAGSTLGENNNNCTKSYYFDADCCNIVGTTAEYSREIIQNCTRTYFRRHIGQPPRSSSEKKTSLACARECVALKEGLLTVDRKLDKASITKFFTPYDVAYAPAIYAAIEKCFDSREADIDSTLPCKSGSYQFLECFYRERFLNCPDSRWTASTACEELKANVTECPTTTVVMAAGRNKS